MSKDTAHLGAAVVWLWRLWSLCIPIVLERTGEIHEDFLQDLVCWQLGAFDSGLAAGSYGPPLASVGTRCWIAVKGLGLSYHHTDTYQTPGFHNHGTLI